MFEPFGQRIHLPKTRTAVGSRAHVGNVRARVYRGGIWMFWLLVAVIIVARIALAVHGSLFTFAP